MLKIDICTVFLVIIISCNIFISAAQPLEKQQQPFSSKEQVPSLSLPIKKPIPASLIKKYKNLNEVEDYYYKVVNRIMDGAVQEMIEATPETHYTIHELQFAGKEHCRISYSDIIQQLDYQLNHKLRYRLLAAIRPLLDSYYQQNDDNANITELNHFVGKQLGIILNVHKLSSHIVRRIYNRKPTSNLALRLWKLMTDNTYVVASRHELNESIALQAWLQSWLSDIEFAITDDFDLNFVSLLLSI